MVIGSLVPLNSTMIAVGLAGIADDLDVSRGSAATLVTAYLVAMLVCQPVAGRMADRFGAGIVLTTCVAAFGVASVAAGFAPTLPALLAGRLAQAAFGAGLIPSSQAILRRMVAAEHRGRAFGMVGSGIGAGAAVGPVLGGLLVGVSSWRAIFFVNVLIVLPGLWLCRGLPSHLAFSQNVAPDDAFGGKSGVKALRQRPFVAACVVQATSNFAMYSVLLLLPLVLDARGWAGASIGAATSGLTVGVLVLAPVGGMLGDRWGRSRPVLLGMSVAFAGSILLAAGVESPALLVAGTFVIGTGMGLTGASLQAAALEAVPVTLAGSAAGVFSTSRYVGSILGSVGIAVSNVRGAAQARPVLVAAVVALALAIAAAKTATASATA